MRTIVVNDEGDLADLRARVLRAGITPVARANVEDQIRAANPHLDFNRLSRGQVVALPDLPEILDELRDHGGATYAAVLDQLDGALGRPARPGRPVLRRPGLRDALGSAELRAVADLDEVLARELTRLGDVLTGDERREAELKTASEAAIARWREGIAALRDVLR